MDGRTYLILILDDSIKSFLNTNYQLCHFRIFLIQVFFIPVLILDRTDHCCAFNKMGLLYFIHQ